MFQTEYTVSPACEKARICINLDTTEENLIIIILLLNIKNSVNHLGLPLWTKLFLKNQTYSQRKKDFLPLR